jgi:hypothetical protein
MNRDQTVKFLELLKAENIQPIKRGGWVISRCPLGPWRHEHGESSAEVFGIKIEPGDAPTHCFSCDWHGSMGDLVMTMRHLNKVNPAVDVKWGDASRMVEQAELEQEFCWDSPDIEELLFGEKAKPHVFPDWWLDSFPRWDEIGWAVEYLQERNCPPSIADALDLRADTAQQRVCFPVRDFRGQLMGLHGRAVHPDVDPRYRMYTQAGKNNPRIWLGESWIDLDKPILVVEGPFDLTSVARVYRNVTSPLFANPSQDKLKRMADALEWVTLLDRGVGGDAGREKIDKVLHKDHIVHHVSPPEGRKDPGACSVEELVEVLSPVLQLDEHAGMTRNH